MQKFFVRLRYILSIVLAGAVTLYIFAFPIVLTFTKKDSPITQIYGSPQDSSVLDLWYVETFEGGNSSRSKYLEKIAKAFTKANKGVYVSITTMTQEQFDINITSNNPDLVSLPYIYKSDFLIDLPRQKVVDKYMDDILSQGEIISYPYMLGRYAIVSRDNITSPLDNQVTTIRKNTIYPFGYSTDVQGYNLLKNTSYTLPSNSKVYDTQYDVYKGFLKGEIKTMLASQRDVHRLKAREQNGTIESLQYTYLDGSTDLVQYIGVTKGSKNKDIAKAFCEFIISLDSQNKIKNIGMFSPFYNIYSQDYMYEWEKSVNYTKIVREDA